MRTLTLHYVISAEMTPLAHSCFITGRLNYRDDYFKGLMLSSTRHSLLHFIKAPIATIAVLFLWMILISASFFWNQRVITQTTQQSFVAKGKGSERLVQILLNWTERHSEVYVPVTAENPSNEYLNTDNKFVTRADGQLLTQISVARILEQFSNSIDDSSLTLSLVSEKPLNPQNLANAWQKDVFNNYHNNAQAFQKTINRQFYYMAPLKANDSCFKCHLISQRDDNNTLGGIVLSYDISYLLKLEEPLHRQNIIIHLAIFILLSMVGYLSLNGIRKLLTQLEFEQKNRDALIEEKTSILKEEIQQHKAARSELQRMSTHDQLTGVRNRRHLLDVLNNELKRYQRYNSDFSVLLIDLDHFSQINDQYGHECGDIVLQSFATQVNKTLRESDVFARYDGEEFAIITINTRLDSALRFAKKLVSDINQLIIVHGEESISLSISIGIAAPSLLSKPTSHQLLSLADHALTQAKLQGRNVAVSAQSLDNESR